MKEDLRRRRFDLLALTVAPFFIGAQVRWVFLVLLLRTQAFTPGGSNSLSEIPLPSLFQKCSQDEHRPQVYIHALLCRELLLPLDVCSMSIQNTSIKRNPNCPCCSDGIRKMEGMRRKTRPNDLSVTLLHHTPSHEKINILLTAFILNLSFCLEVQWLALPHQYYHPSL